MASPAAMAAFFSESDTHLETIEQALITLEKEPANREVVDELFRAVHSLKGNAGLVGLTHIHAIATDMETLLDDIRQGKETVGQKNKDRLFYDLDRMKGLVEKARAGDFSGPAPDKEGDVHDPAPEEHADEHHEEAHEEHHGITRRTADTRGPRSYLTFMLGKEEYGVLITMVREIILRRHITHVPTTKPFLTGIMNLRGMVIPVVDAKRKLGFGGAEDTGENVIIIENEGVVTGMLVDAVKDIVSFEENQMVTADQAMGSMGGEFIDRIGKADKHSILLLDIGKFCDPKERYF